MQLQKAASLQAVKYHTHTQAIILSALSACWKEILLKSQTLIPSIRNIYKTADYDHSQDQDKYALFNRSRETGSTSICHISGIKPTGKQRHVNPRAHTHSQFTGCLTNIMSIKSSPYDSSRFCLTVPILSASGADSIVSS